MPRGRWARPALLAALFIASRLAYAAAGLRFYSDSIYYFMQFLDPELLADRLLPSLWNLHAQPPIFNLIAGLALKIGGLQGFPALMQGVFLASGFASMLLLDGILRLLGSGRKSALTLATLFCVSPPFLFFENWCFYAHLCLTLVLATAFGLLRARGGGGRWFAFSLWSLAALVWMRSLFHPYFLILCAAGAVAFSRRGERRLAILNAVGPVAAVLALGFKNLLVFGFFGTSSWMGLGLHRVAAMDVPRPAMQQLVEAKIVSPISLIPSFSPISANSPTLKGKGDQWTDPALTLILKSPSNPAVQINPWNFNNWTYLETAPLYFRDAVKLIRFDPSHFASAVGWNFKRFLDPVVDDQFIRDSVVGPNPAMKALQNASVWLEGNIIWKSLMGALLLGGIVRIFWRRVSRGERIFLAFACGTCLWVAVIGNIFETGENNRFRYELMGLMLAIGVRLGVLMLRKFENPSANQANSRE